MNTELKPITPGELYEHYRDTLRRCRIDGKSDEDIECDLFEEFDSGTVFLHETALKTLQEAGYIDSTIVDLSLQVWGLGVALLQLGEREVAYVKGSRAWQALFELARRATSMIEQREQADQSA